MKDKLKKENRTNSLYFSALTIAFGIYIIISASFAQQAWGLFSKLLGEGHLKLICVFLIFIVSAIVILFIVRQRFKFLKLTAGIIILVFSFWYAWRQSYFVKNVHMLEYNILGLLAMRDLTGFSRIIVPKKILFSVLFILVIASLDEGLQKLLPYRVGDMQDVVTDVIGGSAGIFLFLLIRTQKSPA